MSSDVFLVGSGFVELRTQGAGPEDSAESSLHVRLVGAGELAAGDELAFLAAGATPEVERQHAAVVLGRPAEILAIDIGAFAAWLTVDAGARLRVGQALAAHLAALQALAADLAGFKNHGKIRLARYLARLFSRMGEVRGGTMALPHAVSHADLAAALGLTRRSVFDDMLSLEEFGAIDHNRSGRLILRDRPRLLRIANLAGAEDRQADAASWRDDVARALAAGDTFRGFELAREALLYHPRDEALRYAAVLAALRSGALREAESLISAFRFNVAASSEAVAALVARAQKERAFAALDRPGLRSQALLAASAYHEVHARFGGSYSALNAAQLYCVAGEAETGLSLARGLTRPGEGYWPLTTCAEALWLLGDAEAALAAAQAARQTADVDEGKLGTTRRQLRRLSTALGRDAAPILDALTIRPVLMCNASDPGLAKLAEGATRLFAVIDDSAELDTLGAVESLEIVLPAPIAALPARALPRLSELMSHVPCHIADAEPGSLTALRYLHARRLALGLALLAASERETSVLCAGEESWPDWAAGNAPAVGQLMLLWVSGAQVPPDIAVLERHAAEDGAILRFARPDGALRAALGLRHHLPHTARLCLDIEPAGTPLARTRLCQSQPAAPDSGLFATDAAAAEIALMRRADLRLQSVGLTRSRRRMNRMRLWAVHQAASWA